MRPDTRRDYAERILAVLVHIQDHLGEPLQLERLAAVAHFSPYHFHRVFRGQVGESVKQHVRRLRLERAAVELKSTRRSVTEIAFDAGYEAHESFTRAFRSAFGSSPSEFRALRNPSTHGAAPNEVHYISGGESLRFDPLCIEDESMQLEIRELARTRVAFLRHVGPYDQVGKTWEALCDWAGRECLFGPDVRHFGASYDDPEVTPADKLRYDACITVDESVSAAGEIGVRWIEGGRYAVAMHEGPYMRLGESYGRMFGQLLPARGLQPGNEACLEFYLNDPEGTEPEELLTEIWVPLARELAAGGGRSDG